MILFQSIKIPMHNYSIIEDLVPDLWKNITTTGQSKLLSECLKRNSWIIRRYTKAINKINSKFLQKNASSIDSSRHKQLILIKQHKSSQQTESKLQVIQEIIAPQLPAQLHTKIQKYPNTRRQNQTVIKLLQVSKTQPSEDQKQASLHIFTPKILSLVENFDSNQQQESKTLSKENKVLFHIRSQKKMIAVCKSEQKKQSQISQSIDKNVHSTIYNEAIGFRKRNFFVSTQNKDSVQNVKHKEQGSWKDLFKIRNTYADQKSFTKKVFELMRMKKSTKILKAKLFSQLESNNIGLSEDQKQSFSSHKHHQKTPLQRFNQNGDVKMHVRLFTPTKKSQSSVNLFDQVTTNSYRQVSQYSSLKFQQRNFSKPIKKNILANLKQRICFFDQHEGRNDSSQIFTFSKILRPSEKHFKFHPTNNSAVVGEGQV